MIIIIRLVNTSNISYSFSFVCSGDFYNVLLNDLQYNIQYVCTNDVQYGVVTIVIMLYVTSPEFFHLLFGSLYPLTTFTHFSHSLPLRNGIFPSMSVNKVPQSSAITALQCEPVSLEDTQEGEENLAFSSHKTAVTPYDEP